MTRGVSCRMSRPVSLRSIRSRIACGPALPSPAQLKQAHGLAI